MASEFATDDRPYAEVKRVGRWTYSVSVVDGMLRYGPDGYGWRVLGRQRAEHKARVELQRYVKRGNVEAFRVDLADETEALRGDA